MSRQGGRLIAALTMSAVLSASGSSQAQELRRDAVSDGVLIGAGAGAAAGVALSLATEEICSPGACAYLGSLTGGLIGLLVDKNVGHSRPALPGSLIDDGLGNGALIGAASGAGIALLEASLRCRPGPGRPPCTRKGTLLAMVKAAQWVALAGILIDAAIPSRLPDPGGALPARADRRFGVRVNLRF
jgi:hypothetical protein